MQSFPIYLIKLITEFVPTPLELVEHELETTGLPLAMENRRRGTFWFGRIHPIKMKDLIAEDDNDGVPAYIAEMRILVRNAKLRQVKMRSDLMAFHLSKV